MNSLIHWKPLKGAELVPESTVLVKSPDNRLIAGIVHPDDPDIVMVSNEYGLRLNNLGSDYLYTYQSDIETFELQ
jgi:hypothetical protein